MKRKSIESKYMVTIQVDKRLLLSMLDALNVLCSGWLLRNGEKLDHDKSCKWLRWIKKRIPAVKKKIKTAHSTVHEKGC